MSIKNTFLDKINSINQILSQKISEYKLYYNKIKEFEKIVSDYVLELTEYVDRIEIKEK